MSLRFEKLVPQVQKMARSVAYRTESISERGQQALEAFKQANDLDFIHQRINLVRERDAGYRGAAPLTEAVNGRFVRQDVPEYAVFVAVDGSQIYPDTHASALYYLTNIGFFVYYHGGAELPLEGSEPYLFYNDSDLREKSGHGSLIKNTVVNARRSVQEVQAATHISLDHWQYPAPLITMLDGPLLWFLDSSMPYAKQLEEEYEKALVNYYDLHVAKREQFGSNASLVGYVERGDSRFVVRLLHLLSLPEEMITRAELDTAGPFEGLSDTWLFEQILDPGERSAVMIQQSPRNKDYKNDYGEPYEVAFFYLNVGNFFKSHIVRIEVPMWVAQETAAVNEVQTLIMEQCALAGRYPYVLTRADELAVVTNSERHQLQNMINIELLSNEQGVDKSPKALGKDLARAPRVSYEKGKMTR